MKTILVTGGFFALFKNRGIIKELGIAQNAIAGLLNMPGAIKEQEINAIANGLKNLSIQQQATVLSTTTLTNAQKVAVLEANDFTNAEISSALATSGLSAATKELTLEEFKNIAAVKAGNVAKADELTTALGLEAAENGRVIGLENITREQFIAVAMQKGYTAAQADALAMSVGYTTANGALALSFKGLTTAIAATAKAIGSTVVSFAAAHPVFLAVVAAVGAVVASYVKWQKTVENANRAIEQAKKSNKENIQATEENIKTLQNAIVQYEKLGKKTKLTSDEKETLISVQDDLNKSFNTEKDGIDLVNGKYEEQLKLIKEFNTEKRKELFDEKTSQYFQTTNDLNSILTFNADDDNAHGRFEWGLIDDTIAAMLEGSKYAALYNQDVADTYAKTKRTNKESTKKVQQAIKDFEDSLNKDIEAGKNLYNVQHAQNVNPGIGNRMGMYGATFNPEATAEDILNYYKAVREYLNNNLNYEDKKDNPYYSVVSNYLDNQISAIESQLDETTKLLTERAELAFNIFGVTIGDEFVTIDNLTEENALIWKNTLVKTFAEDDPDLRKAIEDYYHYNVIPNIKRGNEEVISEGFNFSDFYKENGLEDIIKLFGKVQTAYKNIESDPNGFNLDDEILKEFPELVNYLDDTDKLKEKLQELVNVKIEPLITSLKELQENLPKDSDDYKAISNTISWLEKQADITTKVKEKTTKTSDLYKDQKLQIHENIQALEREVKTIDKQISALEKKKDLQEKYIKTLEKEKDRLEDLIDDYETAASTVKDYIDEQNDGLEKQKDKIEERYDVQIKAIEETYDKQVKLIEAQEEGFDKQIKALQDEADEQDRLNKLKEKELALEKAKNEKVRVYTAEKGWQIMENSEAVSAARKELEEAQREDTIAKLEKEKERLEQEKERLQSEKEQRTSEIENLKEKEIEALQAEMDKLKEYKKAWKEAIAAYKKAQDKMTTAAILGADWRTKLAEQDKTIIEDYKNGYEGVQNQLNNSVIPMIELANKELDTYSEQIDKLKEQKDLYKDMEDNQKKYLDFYKTYAEQFADATKEQSDAVEALNKALATNTLLTNMDNTDKAWDWAKSLFDEDYIREYPDYNGGTAASSGLIGKLASIFKQSTSVYVSFTKSIPNLLDKVSGNFSADVMAMGKLIADSVTNNKSNTDNRTQTINFNNPGFAMTYADFEPMFMETLRRLDQQAQTGKR